MSTLKVAELISTHDDFNFDHHQGHGLNNNFSKHIENENENGSVDDSSDLIIAKVTAMIVLLIASAICGCIPFLLNYKFKWTENNVNARSATIVQCLLYFGGGVLLCTTFLHLLPEVNETIEELIENGTLPEMGFHLAPFLMCCGFFAMYFVEEIVHIYIHRHQKLMNKDVAAFERGKSIRGSHMMKAATFKKNINEEGETDKTGTVTANGLNISDKITVQDLINNDIENQKQQSQDKINVTQNHNNNVHNCDQKVLTTNCGDTEPHYHHHSHGNGHSHLQGDMIVSSLRGLLIVLALSIHELFEGLAVGLSRSPSNVWYMFGAVSAHKLVLSFCVGVELIVTRTRIWLAMVYVLTFSAVSPIGIFIGIMITDTNNTATYIPSAILQGLATGTLLYVVFFEILSKEKSGLISFAAFLFGFFCMFGLQFATGHEHSHDQGHSHDDDSHHDHDGEHSHDTDHSKTGHLSSETLEKQLQLLREASEGLRIQLQQRKLIQN